jgi:iron complex outermembrane recepter protein
MGSVNAVGYAKYHEHDGLKKVNDGDVGDDGGLVTGGARVDGVHGKTARWTVSGDGYTGKFDEPRTVFSPVVPFSTVANVHTLVNGGNLTASGSRQLPAGEISVNTYWEHSQRKIPEILDETRDTGSLDIKHELPVARRHTLTWGAGARVTRDGERNTFGVAWDPPSEVNHLYSLFGQDEYQVNRRLWLTLGSKFERNDYTRWEAQPSGRLGWRLSDEHLLWGAVSRAVRTPTRFDEDVRAVAVATPGPAFLAIHGDNRFVSEKLVAYEAGYRGTPSRRVFIDVAGFYNRYYDLSSLEPGTPFVQASPGPATIVPFFFENRAWGESFGGEIAPRVELLPWWRLETQYSYLHLRLHADRDSGDFVVANSERNDPIHRVSVVNDFTLPHRVVLTATVRWVDDLPNLGVRDYGAFDLGTQWAPTPAWKLDLEGRNLLEHSHREFSGVAEVEPSVYGRISWFHR